MLLTYPRYMHNVSDMFNTVPNPLYELFSGRWNNFVKGYLPRWRTFNLLWLRDFKGPMHVIFYEDLKEDMRRELKKIAEFLRVQPMFMECALQNSQGNFLRKNKTDYRQVYDKELTKLAEQSSLEVYNAALSEHGFCCLHCRHY